MQEMQLGNKKSYVFLYGKSNQYVQVKKKLIYGEMEVEIQVSEGKNYV